MEALHTKVRIILRTTITDQEDQERNELIHTGYFYRNNTFDVLKFDEKLEEGASVRNLITLQKEKVTIKRSGAVSMNQKFEKDKKSENVYHHPHGTMHMETFTNTVYYQPLDEMNKGQLKMDYQVTLNGQANRKHELTLIFKEENAQ